MYTINLRKTAAWRYNAKYLGFISIFRADISHLDPLKVEPAGQDSFVKFSSLTDLCNKSCQSQEQVAPYVGEA